MKKGLAFFVALSMLVSMLPAFGAFALAAESSGEETVWYDLTKKATLDAWNLKKDTKTVKNEVSSAKWELASVERMVVDTAITDISDYAEIRFWAHSNAAEPVKAILRIDSENKDTEGDDYYSYSLNFNWDGWKEVVIPISDLKASRTPVGLDKISKFWITASGWNQTPNKNGVVYLENIRLAKGAPPKPTVPVKDAEGDVGAMLYLNKTFDGETDPLAGLSLQPKNYKIEYKEQKGNGFLQFTIPTDAEASDCYFDATVTPNRFVVLETDIMVGNGGFEGNIFQFKDANKVTGNLFSVNAAGEITFVKAKTKVATLKDNVWLKLAAVLDMETNTCDIYVDGKLAFSGLSYADDSVTGLSSVRMYLSKSKANFGKTVMIDNYKIYEGKEPREIKPGELPPKSPIVPDKSKEAITLLGKMGSDVVALNVPAGTIYYNGAKHALDVGPYITNDRTLIPVRAVSEAFGCTVDWNEETATATIDGNTKITIGSADMVLADGSIYTLDVPAEVTNDRTFIPLRALGEKALGKAVTWDERGLILLGEKEYSSTEYDLEAINNFLLYDRPSAETVQSLYAQKNAAHPRVLLDKSGFDRIRENYKSNEYVKEWGDVVIKQADVILDDPMPEHVLPDDKRLLNTSNKVSDRMIKLGMAYQLTGDKKYVDCAYKNLYAAGSFPDWNPSHYLDVGEMSYGFAIGYDWMYDAYTDEQRKFIEEAIYKHSFDVTQQAYYNQNGYNWWVKVDHNWNSWVNGSMIVASIAFFDKYPEVCSDLISVALRAQEYMLPNFYPDGAWMEGVGYWDATVKPVARYVDTLRVALGTDFNITKTPGLEKTAYFALNAQGPKGINSYHDTGTSMGNYPSLFWFSREYNDPDLTKVRLYQMEKYNFAPTIYDMIWYNTEISDKRAADLAKDVYFRGVELVSMRASFTNDSGAFLSYHGGQTVVNHYHVDSGTYVLDMLGERFAVDLGSEDYSTIEHGTKNRLDYYRVRAEGHNVYVINPAESGVGQENKNDTFSQVECLESSERGAYSIVDLTQAYANQVTKARRGFKMEDDRRSVVVRDEFTLKKKDSEIYWFVHTGNNVELLDNRTAVITVNGAKVKATITTNVDSAELSVMDAAPLETSPKVPTQNANASYKKLALHMKASDDVIIQIKYVPYDDPIAEKEVPNIPLDEWKNEEGALRVAPLLDSLSVNGAPVDGFNPEVVSYTLKYPYDATEVPQVSASAGDGIEVEILQSQAVGESTRIKVYYKDDPTLASVYTVNQLLMPQLNDVNGMKRHQVFNITSSPDTQVENPDSNAADNDIGTRWAASGPNQWITFDYGSKVQIDALGISVMQGDKRMYTYSIFVSDDGENWTQVVDHAKTDGKTEDIVIYPIESVNARYLKYVGFGNTVNEWNSVTEIAALQNK